MPLPTPNRGYPYSVPGDPADVPAAIQALAEAIDADATNLESLVGARDVAHFTGTTTVINQQAVVPSELPLETVDFDNTNGGVSGITNGSVFVNAPGFWFAFGTLVYSAWPGASNIDYVSLDLYNRQANTEIAINSIHAAPALSEISRQMDVGSGVLVLPGNPVQVELRSEVGRSAGLAQYPLRTRTLTLIRMTDMF